MSSPLSVSHFQLVPYWEKTFHIDLSSPQIGVVDVEDVSKNLKREVCFQLFEVLLNTEEKSYWLKMI